MWIISKCSYAKWTIMSKQKMSKNLCELFQNVQLRNEQSKMSKNLGELFQMSKIIYSMSIEYG